MANDLLTSTLITREAMRVLVNNLKFSKNVNRDLDNRFAVEGAKIGNVANVRKPPRFLVSDGQALDLQDATETSVAVKLDKQKHVDFQFSSVDLLLSIDDFSERFLKPACAALANAVDLEGLLLYKDIYQTVGTPGIVPATALVYLNAGAALDDSCAPDDGLRCIVYGPRMQPVIVDALKGLFQQAAEIGKQYRTGKMGTSLNFDWYMSQNIATHTVGALGGAPLINGASQIGASLITDGWTAAAATRLLRGDTFTVAGLNHVNPQSRLSSGVLQQFVATADAASDGAGNMTIPIDPPIVTAGPFQTVDSAVVDNAALTISGAANTQSPQGLAFHRDAFTLAMADLPVPNDVDMGARASDKDLGISVRILRKYSIETDQWPVRIDVLFGWKTTRAELACRVQS